METNVSIVIDKRRQKTSTSNKGKFPVKLRVYSPTLGKAKLYKLDINLTEDHFKKVCFPIEGQRLSKELKDIETKLNSFKTRATKEIENLDSFVFDDFERNFFRDRKAAKSPLYHYNEKISFLKKVGKVSTAESYQCSINSIEKFLKEKNKKVEALRFAEINKNWLKEYEQYMLNEKRSKTTIGIYLRPLSSIFNNAIESKDVSKDYYPFGKKKYTIPKGGGIKKALSKEQLSRFFYAETKTPQQEKAKDFWFLSYSLNGMNIQDIAVLKFKDLKEDRIEYVRTKTKDTNKKLKQITTYLNEYSISIIEKYKRKHGQPNDYVFEILESGLSPEQEKGKVKRFTRFINQHIKIIAVNNVFPGDISTYWARHTFATMSVNKGASLEFMSEALGHSDLSTTQIYFAGFTNEIKKEFSQSIMDF